MQCCAIVAVIHIYASKRRYFSTKGILIEVPNQFFFLKNMRVEGQVLPHIPQAKRILVTLSWHLLFGKKFTLFDSVGVGIILYYVQLCENIYLLTKLRHYQIKIHKLRQIAKSQK